MTDDDVLARVRYSDGQFLRVDDFQDEQDYHLGRQRRHNISGHTWGIVCGLDVTASPRAVQVSAGSAVDVLGRVIVLAHEATLSLSPQGQTFNVWIRYEETLDPVDDGCAGVGAGRVQEHGRFQLDDNVDPPPAEVRPDDPRYLYVFLGRVELDPLRPDDPPVVRLATRRYTGLVGTRVEAPSRSTALQFSGGPGRGGEPGVFEVLATTTPEPEDLKADADKDPRAVLTISGDGWAKLVGDLTVEGSLTLDGDMLVFGLLPAQTDPSSEKAAADRQSAAKAAAAVEAPADSAAEAITDSAPEPWSVRQVAGPPPQLQIVLPTFNAVTGEAAASFTIGTWSEDRNEFIPALTVHADGTVDIPGTLRVGGLEGQDGGQLPPGTIVDGGLDPEARRMVSAAAMSGIAGGSGLAATLYRPGTGGVQPATQPSPQAAAATTRAASEAAEEPERWLARAVAAALAADETLLTDLAATLRDDHPELAAALREALPDGAPGGPG